ncbi:MAG TPA: hypothetical protein P5529_06905 [Saccharofermentans sp.]|nr:hypothetical protein [Saccharofermentans sp.]
MSMKKILMLVLIASMLLSMTGCHKAVPRQSDRHEGIEEFEDEVLQELGDYIFISDPHLIEDNGDRFQLGVSFLSDYVASEEMQESKSYYEVIEEFRLAFNDYYSRNPNWIVSKYSYVLVSFYIEPEGLFTTEGSEIFARLSNQGIEERYDNLSTVEYSIRIFPENYQFLTNCEGVRCIYIDEEFSSITEIIDSMPDLSSVYVFDASYVDRLSELYPDIAFAECTWFHY